MTKYAGEIIVGILGQWASGKSSAAKILIRYLGGENKTIFITDRVFVVGQAVKYILGEENSKGILSLEADGSQRLDSDHGTVWLSPEEDLQSVDLNRVRIDIPDDIYDKELPAWLNNARLELGNEILKKAAEGKPIVIEAGFGKIPIDHTISDLFLRLGEAGVDPKRVKWIVIEASFEIRSKRNERRQDTVPDHLFNRYAGGGGDLDPDQQKRLGERGTTIRRVFNDHNNFEKFKADLIAAFTEMYGDVPHTETSKQESE